MASGISLRQLSFAVALFFFSCGNTSADDAEDTTVSTADTVVQAKRESLKDKIQKVRTDTATLLLSTEQKAALSKDPPQKVAQYRSDIAQHLPAPQNWVNDYDNLFTSKEEDDLNTIIAGFEKESGMQIAVITLDTFCVSNANMSDAGLKIYNAWGLGTREKNDGLLITIIKGYGFMRMNTGSGTQQILSDHSADSIMRAAFFPSLAKKEFYKGTLTGLNALVSYLRPNTGKIK